MLRFVIVVWNYLGAAWRKFCCFFLLQTTNGKKKGQKSGSKKKNSKTKNHSLRRSSKSGLGNSDLSAKLFTTMEKHKEVILDVFICLDGCWLRVDAAA